MVASRPGAVTLTLRVASYWIESAHRPAGRWRVVAAGVPSVAVGPGVQRSLVAGSRSKVVAVPRDRERRRPEADEQSRFRPGSGPSASVRRGERGPTRFQSAKLGVLWTRRSQGGGPLAKPPRVVITYGKRCSFRAVNES